MFDIGSHCVFGNLLFIVEKQNKIRDTLQQIRFFIKSSRNLFELFIKY